MANKSEKFIEYLETELSHERRSIATLTQGIHVELNIVDPVGLVGVVMGHDDGADHRLPDGFPISVRLLDDCVDAV